jgi:hypothetical protein
MASKPALITSQTGYEGDNEPVKPTVVGSQLMFVDIQKEYEK